jgi:hypothetical protein
MFSSKRRGSVARSQQPFDGAVRMDDVHPYREQAERVTDGLDAPPVRGGVRNGDGNARIRLS